jgi:hypothetical protein
VALAQDAGSAKPCADEGRDSAACNYWALPAFAEIPSRDKFPGPQYILIFFYQAARQHNYNMFARPRQRKTTLIAPLKKRKRDAAVEEINFDFDKREEYLTGFHKRKVQRAKQAQEEAAKKAREERIATRKQVSLETFYIFCIFCILSFFHSWETFIWK